MMMGKSALTKRMKRRSALASDWLEKNQSELAENTSNGINPVLDGSDKDNIKNSNGFFNGDICDNYDEGGKINALSFSGDEKSSTDNFREINNLSGFKGKSTVDHEPMKERSLVENHASVHVSWKQATESKEYNSSGSVVTCDIDENNINSPSVTRITIQSQSKEHDHATKYSSENNSKLRGNIGPQNVKDNSNTKRKRMQAVETTSTSQDVDSSLGDEAEEKPTKKRKMSDGGVCEEENEGQVENRKMEADEDELSQPETTCEGSGTRKRYNKCWLFLV